MEPVKDGQHRRRSQVQVGLFSTADTQQSPRTDAFS